MHPPDLATRPQRLPFYGPLRLGVLLGIRHDLSSYRLWRTAAKESTPKTRSGRLARDRSRLADADVETRITRAHLT